MDSRINWGYAFNQWKFSFQDFARVEDNVRALKVTAACGFRAIEMNAGTGPWEPLGRPESIAMNFGSAQKFKLLLADWGIEQVASVFYDPGQMSFEELHHGLMPTCPGDHGAILQRARIHSEFLAEMGGDCLVVRPFPSFWKQGALNDERLQIAAECWHQVGAMTKALGVKTVLHLDALSALRSTDEVDKLLDLLSTSDVALAFDTAELTIAGHDVVALYRRYHEHVQHFHFKDALAVDTLDEYRLQNAERAMIAAGGSREISRWFCEMGTPEGLVDFHRLLAAMQDLGYRGWIIVESDKGPQPAASSMMLNRWYVQHVLKQDILKP
jgi:inosose dehydratase